MIRAPRISPTLLVGAVVWAASLGLYLSTLAPTLTWGYNKIGVDGGELLTAASTLGVPHPPGYPTYTLLLKLFATVVPVGDFAHRGNLLSAVLAAASVAMLYWAILRICRYLRPEGPKALWVASGALGATVLATSPLFWSQSVITEVYTLNALFVGALLLIASYLALPPPGDRRLEARSTTWLMVLFAFLLGLGLGNHLTLLAVAVPLLYWIWMARGWRALVSHWAGVALILGLGIYIYLPVSAAQGPPVNWGNADTFGGIVWMLSGRLYQDHVFGVPVGSFAERGVLWLELVFSQFNPLGMFLGLIGAVSLRSRQGGFLAATAVSIAALIVYSFAYNTVDSQVLAIPAFYIFSVWVGVGFLAFLAALSSSPAESSGAPKTFALGRLRFGSNQLVLVSCVVAFGALPITSVILNYSSQNLRHDRQAYEYAREILDSVPDGSLVLSTQEDSTFSLWYLRYVEETERDVAPIAVPLLQFDWYWRDIHARFPDRLPAEFPDDHEGALRTIVEHNDRVSRVFLTDWHPSFEDAFELRRVGRLYEASPKSAQ